MQRALSCDSINRHIHGAGKQTSGCRGWEGWGPLAEGHGLPWADEKLALVSYMTV